MQRRTLLALLPLFAACTDEVPRPVGGEAELAFDDVAGDVDTSPLPATDVQSVYFDEATRTRVIGVFAFEPEVDGFRRKAWQLALMIQGDPPYTIGTNAGLEYDQQPAPGSQSSWEATSGSIAVESMTGTAATFSFSSIPMTGTTGTFSFSGTITVDR